MGIFLLVFSKTKCKIQKLNGNFYYYCYCYICVLIIHDLLYFSFISEGHERVMLGSVWVTVCRRNGIQAKRLPGMHPISAAQWCHAGPGGASEDHPRRAAWLPGSLQQLRFPLSEQRSMCGETQWFFLPLCPVSLHRGFLWWRYIFYRQFMLVNMQEKVFYL